MAEPLTCDAVVDEGLIGRYLAGMLSEVEVEALESHYLTCARCQNELRLATAIRDVLPEVQEAAPAPDVSPALLSGRWLRRHARVGAVAAAIAAVLAGVLFFQPGEDTLPHREPALGTADVPTVEAPIGEVGTVSEFRWSPVASADLYKLTLYNVSGDVVWEVDTRETHVGLPDAPRLEPGVPYLWQVDARVDWDHWVSSELVRFRIVEP
ncbi:MAG: zf-HC2 domain-containing protein [Gemmatimonadales bacterium]